MIGIPANNNTKRVTVEHDTSLPSIFDRTSKEEL